MHQGSRRFALRQKSASAHAQVDEAVGSFGSIESYGRYLRGISAFRAPIEARLASISWPQEIGPWRPTTIGAALDRDIEDLRGMEGLGFGYNRSNQRADTALWPPPRDLNALVGLLYVLEGSSLGARVLYRRAEALGLTGEFGARHLAGQTGSGGNWHSFLDMLETLPNLDIDDTAAAAVDAFRAAQHAFAIDA